MGNIRIEKLDRTAGSKTIKEFDSVDEAYTHIIQVLEKTDKLGVDHGDYVVDGPEEEMKNPIRPQVGMAATINYWTDRDPATIIRVSESGKTVWVTGDKHKVISGSEHNGSAEYEYESDPDSHPYQFSIRNNGRWIQAGSSAKSGTSLALGRRRRYRDPSF
jgi:hypothetical protein